MWNLRLDYVSRHLSRLPELKLGRFIVPRRHASVWLTLLLLTASNCSAQMLSYVEGRGHTESYTFQGRIPIWNGAAMLKIDDGFISSWAADGRQLLVATVQIPESSELLVFDAAAKVDGGLVACGWAKDSDGRVGGFLYFIRPDRTEPRIVRTAPYVPAKVVIASDNSLWTVGYDANPYAVRDKNTTVIRHFDASGRLLEGFLKQASLQDRGIEMPGTGEDSLALSSSGVAAWCGAHAQTYVEVTGGQVHEYPGVPLGDHEFVDGLAILQSGETIASVTNHYPGVRLYSLNRSTGSWRQVLGSADVDVLRFLGQSGERLVLQSKSRVDFRFAEIK